MASPLARKPWYRILYIQVLIGMVAGIATGYFFPEIGTSMKPFGDGFIKLVKMIIAPIVFCTVAHGIASMGDFKKLGRIGIKTLLYFEIVSTFALVIGLIVVNLWRPGSGLHIDPRALDPKLAASYVTAGHPTTAVEFLLNIIPRSFFDAFATGDILQVLLVSLLTGLALSTMGAAGKPVLHGIEQVLQVFFRIIQLVVYVAPIAAFGAMGFTVGNYGIGSLRNLLALVGCFYLTAGVFVVVVLGTIARYSGFSIFRFLAYIRDELFLTLGASSSEPALPGMLVKLRKLGCADSTVGFVIPTGYSFNLDGTNIYMTMSAVFLAQATDTPLTLGQQLTLLVIAMISSKGATGATGSGFVTLAATLASVPSIPIQSLALIVGIDRFMSECRAVTNLIGNGVATVVISRWEGEVEPAQLQQALHKQRDAREEIKRVDLVADDLAREEAWSRRDS